MGFRENLQYLRSTRDMSQADLAQHLDVSRQSVAKWEAEKSYPEMDKLIRICDLFDCSLDELVRGDLTGAEGKSEAEAMVTAVCEAEVDAVTTVVNARGVEMEAAAACEAEVDAGREAETSADEVGDESAALCKPKSAGAIVDATASEAKQNDSTARTQHEPAAAAPLDEFGYDEHMRRRAWDYAVGMAAIVLSVGVGFLVSYTGPGGTPVPFVLAVAVGVGVALFLSVPAYTGHQLFLREHPHIEDFYTSEQKAEARRWKALGIAGAVALAAAGLNMPGLFATFQQYTFSGLAMFLCFAAAVGVLVYTVMMDHRIDVARYNAAAPATTAKEC